MTTDRIKSIQITVEPWVIDASLVEMRMSVLVFSKDGEHRKYTLNRPLDKPDFVSYFDQIFNEAKKELKELVIPKDL